MVKKVADEGPDEKVLRLATKLASTGIDTDAFDKDVDKLFIAILGYDLPSYEPDEQGYWFVSVGEKMKKIYDKYMKAGAS